MQIKDFFRKIFEKGNPGLGWFVFWRLALALLPLNLISRLLAEQGGPDPVAGVGILFALPVGGNLYLVPLAIPVTLVLLNWIGKGAMEKRLGVKPAGFIGWALYWRFALLQLVGLLALGLAFVPLGFLFQGLSENGAPILLSVAGIIGLPALIFWNLNVLGFAIRKVAGGALAEGPGEAPATRKTRAKVRDFRDLFNISEFGMNWLVAAAYFASGVIGLFLVPLVRGLFSGDIEFGPARGLPGFLFALGVGGLGLSVALHRAKNPWQAVAMFAVVVGLSEILIATPLEKLLEARPGDDPWFDPAGVVSSLSYAVFFCSGLLAGLRFLGPTISGFAAGIGIGQLIHGILIVPLVYSLSMDIEMAFFLQPEILGTRVINLLLDALVTGAALWWVCDWHLGKNGLRLNQQGAIVPRLKP